MGRWLIAHELAHVLQQDTPGRSDGGSYGALERAADSAAMTVAMGGFTRVAAAPQAPAVQFATAHEGFSRALDDFAQRGNGNDITALAVLRAQSPTFRALTTTLDAHYVWLHDPAFDPPASAASGISLLEIDHSGRVTKPPWAAGRRVLVMSTGASSFRPYGDPSNSVGADLITLQESNADPMGSFIQAIAHEATHARAFVSGAAKPPATLAAAVAAGIADEIAARTSEATILGEIKNPTARRQFQPVGSRKERDVQRDVSPAFNLTYLENFFFGRQLEQAQAREKLSDDLTRQIRETVEHDPSAPPPLLRGNRLEYSDYVRIWFARQAAVREWVLFAEKHRPGDPDFLSEREALLQDHARRFFNGRVSYLP
jgi:hypothetical protein